MYKFFIQSPNTQIDAVGPDAFDFLQSQFSNDLRNAGNSPVYGFWLDRKGRIRGDSLVFRTGNESLRIISRHTPASELRAFLEEKIIADDLELTPCDQELSLLSIWNATEASGPAVGDTLAGHVGFADPTLPSPGVSWLIPASTIDQARQELQSTFSQIHFIHDEEWIRDSFIALHPRIPTDLVVDVFPQEIGLDDFVHYNKGCFLGQEVMARLRYQGKTKRFLKLFIGTAQSPDVGTPLLVEEKKIGVVLGYTTHQQETLLLAIGNWPEESHTPLVVYDANGQAWTAGLHSA